MATRKESEHKNFVNTIFKNNWKHYGTKNTVT